MALIMWHRVMALIAAVVSSGSAATVYVAPQGRDGARGTSEDPVGSIAAARAAARAIRKNGERGRITIALRGGGHRLAETRVVGAEDSDVTFEAYAGERPIVSGGRRIEGWKKRAGPVWTAPAGWDFRQLFVNGRRALRARTPTNGFYRIDGPSSQDKPFLLKYRGEDVKKEWAGRGVEVIALLAW